MTPLIAAMRSAQGGLVWLLPGFCCACAVVVPLLQSPSTADPQDDQQDSTPADDADFDDDFDDDQSRRIGVGEAGRGS
ncbi:hypothetical protein V8D89_005630 [Ganoderma adspersum]